jgi:hypothetical protein
MQWGARNNPTHKKSGFEQKLKTAFFYTTSKKQKIAAHLVPQFQKFRYSELSPFAGLLSTDLLSAALLSFGAFSLLASAFFTPDVSPEGDL